MSNVTLEWSYASLRGHGHQQNDDHGDGRLREDDACFVLCDGLGGHEGGALASHAFTDRFLDGLPPDVPNDAEAAVALLSLHVNSAAQQMREALLAQAPGLRPHTTCVVAYLCRGFTIAAHVGDSRFYLLRGGSVVWRSKDHSVARLLEDQDADAVSAAPEDGNKLYRALGTRESAKVSTAIHAPLGPNDAVVLCTDGFWRDISEDVLRELATAEDLRHGATEMLERVQAVHGDRPSDDCSVIVIRPARIGP